MTDYSPPPVDLPVPLTPAEYERLLAAQARYAAEQMALVFALTARHLNDRDVQNIVDLCDEIDRLRANGVQLPRR